MNVTFEWHREYVQLVAERLVERQRKLVAEFAAKRWDFAGVQAVMNQDPDACAVSWEPKRSLNPQVAARDKELRIQLIEAHQAFLNAYQRARDSWRRGNRRVRFPAGTYWMRVFLNVRCDQPTEATALVAA